MNATQVRAWILLSVPTSPGGLASIITVADAHNKAIPTLSELSDALGWLRAAELVAKQDALYSHTPAGRNLLANCSVSSPDFFSTWDRVAKALESLSVPSYEPDVISEESLRDAVETSSRRFWEMFRRLPVQDA